MIIIIITIIIIIIIFPRKFELPACLKRPVTPVEEESEDEEEDDLMGFVVHLNTQKRWYKDDILQRVSKDDLSKRVSKDDLCLRDKDDFSWRVSE